MSLSTLLGVNLWFVACALPLGLGPLRALVGGTLAPFGGGWTMTVLALVLGGLAALAPLGVLWLGRSLPSGPMLFALVTLWPELLAQAGWVQPAPFWWVALLWLGYLWTAHARPETPVAAEPTREPVRVVPATASADGSLAIFDGLALLLGVGPLLVIEAVLSPWRAAGGVDASTTATAGALLGLVGVGALWLGWIRWGVLPLLRAHLRGPKRSASRLWTATAACLLAAVIYVAVR